MTEAPSKYFFRQRRQNRQYEAVISAIEKEAARSRKSRKDIAKILGIPPSQVTRLLSGPANWTSDTISDLLFAIDAEMDFKVVFFRDRPIANAFHPVGEVHQQWLQQETAASAPILQASPSSRYFVRSG